MKSHRTGRRRKKGGSKLPVAPWIFITLVCVLVASALTAGFVTLLRAGCGGDVYKVQVAAAGNIAGSLEDLAREWEAQEPEVDGRCVGVNIQDVPAVEASRGLTGEWDTVSHGRRPIAWVPDSDVWPEWVTGTEVTADYFSSDPVLLGESKTVLAVPEPRAQELGWLGGQPPSWSAILDAALAEDVRLAAVNPRTSTEGLHSMLNAVSDGAGGVSSEAMTRYSEALNLGQVADSADELFSAYLEAEDPAAFADVFTALDYQVEEFNEESELDHQMVPITPSGSELNAVYPYVVLDGAGWVSPSDARIASMFGGFLQTAASLSAFEDAGISPVEAGAEVERVITGETVRDAMRRWYELRQDWNVLIVVDRSSFAAGELVEYGGETVEASVAAIRLAVAFVGELGSGSRAGLAEFGVGAGDEGPLRVVSEPAEMSSDNKESLTGALYSISEHAPYEGGSPLFDTVTAAYAYMSEHAIEGADNAIVVLTNGGSDSESLPTIEETEQALSDAAVQSSVSVYTVGFGNANTDYLQRIATAANGSYLDAPSSGGLMGALRDNLVN
ncbi:vWA domain-containing protein [Glycomyces tarimensis]